MRGFDRLSANLSNLDPQTCPAVELVSVNGTC